MKQRFFFDGINVPGNQFTINQCLQVSGRIFANAAYAAATVFDHTTMTAKMAFDLVFLQRIVEVSFHFFAPEFESTTVK
jgi:hypothetical protein